MVEWNFAAVAFRHGQRFSELVALPAGLIKALGL